MKEELGEEEEYEVPTKPVMTQISVSLFFFAHFMPLLKEERPVVFFQMPLRMRNVCVLWLRSPVFPFSQMSLACSIHRIPFDGLSDESSVKNILAQLRPRKLVSVSHLSSPS